MTDRLHHQRTSTFRKFQTGDLVWVRDYLSMLSHKPVAGTASSCCVTDKPLLSSSTGTVLGSDGTDTFSLGTVIGMSADSYISL